MKNVCGKCGGPEAIHIGFMFLINKSIMYVLNLQKT